MAIVTQFDPAAAGGSGFFVQVLAPPSFVRAVPTSVIGVVGTASYGPVNRAQHLGAGTDAVLTYGPTVAASITDPYDLSTDLNMAFLQASSQASLQCWAVRVTDGTDVAATSALTGTATATPATITVGGTITAGDTVSPTATSSALTGSPIVLGPYTVVTADTTATIAVAIAGLINANATLAAAGVNAVVASSVVTIYWPAALSPTITWTAPKTGTTETYTVGAGSTTTAGATLTAVSTGSGGNLIKAIIATGTAANSFTVTLLPPYGGPAEIFSNIPSANFWSKLKAALAQGQGPTRPPSTIATIPGAAISGVGVPTVGTYSFTGGTDGRAGVTTSTLIGSDTALPKTGLYALRNLNPGVAIAWIAGNTDSTTATTLAAFGESEGCKALWCFPSGTSSTTALTNVATMGVSDPALDYLKDFIYILDEANKVTRLIPPYSVYAGMYATLSPEQSPDNKKVYGVVGSERNNTVTGNLPYSSSEIGQLQSAGIAVIKNPIPSGFIWGVHGGQSSSLDPATQPSEYWRMTAYIAKSLDSFGGKYIGQVQSASPSDPLRRQIKVELNQFFSLLQGLGQIDTYAVICDFTTIGQAGFGFNNPASIAQHYLFAMVKVRYLSSVRWFILTLQGGTTTNVQINSTAPLAAA